MTKLLMFVPWEKDQTSDFWNSYTLDRMKKNWRRAQQKRPEQKRREVEMIFYTGRERKRLRNIADSASLYVVGHCQAGSDNLYASESGAHPLDYAAVAQRIADSGLRQDFTRSVKLYGCQGGKASGGAVGWSFVEALALILAGAHDYNDCTVVGYKHSASARYHATGIEEEEQKHKAVVDDEGAILGRAKDFRVFYRGGNRVNV